MKHTLQNQWKWKSFRYAPKELQNRVWNLAEEQYQKSWKRDNRKAHNKYLKGLRK